MSWGYVGQGACTKALDTSTGHRLGCKDRIQVRRFNYTGYLSSIDASSVEDRILHIMEWLAS